MGKLILFICLLFVLSCNDKISTEPETEFIIRYSNTSYLSDVNFYMSGVTLYYTNILITSGSLCSYTAYKKLDNDFVSRPQEYAREYQPGKFDMLIYYPYELYDLIITIQN